MKFTSVLPLFLAVTALALPASPDSADMVAREEARALDTIQLADIVEKREPEPEAAPELDVETRGLTDGLLLQLNGSLISQVVSLLNSLLAGLNSLLGGSNGAANASTLLAQLFGTLNSAGVKVGSRDTTTVTTSIGKLLLLVFDAEREACS